ncbi:RelA/SpoT domain-containing protein [Buchananella felis]|uniref:RelA/SpoT domain-containing protein n=1 Tax=Buchananella felis TaxID=3231492 RepID=UPI0035272F58
MEQPSKSAVRKAGSWVRTAIQSGVSLEQVKESSQMQVITNYRNCFTEPMRRVTDGLVTLLSEHGLAGQVSSRLKRAETIIDKISNRERGLDLSRMQDIGGCRVVLDSLPQVRTLEQAVLSHWASRVLRTNDYYKEPRPSGYRSIHIVVQEQGRPIEIQLRSPLAHSFAQMVEALSQQFGTNYKQDGDSPVHRSLAQVARLVSELESSQPHIHTIRRYVTETEALISSIVDELGRGDQGVLNAEAVPTDL